MLVCAFLLPCVFLLLLSVVLGAASGPSGYHIAKKTVLGGDGGWDYLIVDSHARRLYISRSTHVMVVDVENATVVGDIPNTAGVHGIALAPDMDKGFTSNGGDGTVTIFDLCAHAAGNVHAADAQSLKTYARTFWSQRDG